MARKDVEKCDEIRKCIETWENYWKDCKNDYNEYTQFIWGNQWLDEEARVFESYKKIPLTFNKLAPLANHILGEQRQNTPSLQVVPSNDVPEPVAEVREALVKEISLNSKAKNVYQIAFQSALVGGYGAYYIDTEYEGDYTFNQILTIRALAIATRGYWDHSAMCSTKTDGRHGGFRERMSRSKFGSVYGKRIELDIPPSNIEEGSVFNDDESVTICTHWERKYETEMIYQLSNGRVVNKKELDGLKLDENLLQDNGEIVTIENERKSPKYRVMKYVCAGDYILNESEFPSELLPLVFVDQNSFFNKEGTQVTRSFFKDTKDAQRYINYLGTQSAYLVKIGRYDQFLIEAGNARSNDTAQIWRDPANIQGGLKFDPVPSGFIPQQLKPPELSQSLIQQYERAERDIQTTTGLYNTMMGDQGNETSKLAIDARTKRGAYNTFVPFDRLNFAIAIGGKIINQAIPKIYDTERTLTLMMKDKGQQPVTINKKMDDYGINIQNDMTAGKYDIRLEPGPSFEGQKEESLNSMQLILQSNPQLFNLIADLYVENLPLANSLQLRNRLKTIVPPEIIEAGKTGQPIPPKPPEPDPMVMVKMRELELKQQEIQMKAEKIKMEEHVATQETQMKWEQIEAEKEESAAQLEEMKLRYLAELQRTQSDENIAHANNLIKLLTHVNKDKPHASTEKR